MFVEQSSIKHMILSKPCNLIGWHGNPKAKFAKKYSKLNSSEAILRRKQKLFRNVQSIIL